MSIHRDHAKPPLTLPQYVPTRGADISSSLDVRDVSRISSAELAPLPPSSWPAVTVTHSSFESMRICTHVVEHRGGGAPGRKVGR